MFLKTLRAIDLELSQSGELYLVISITINKKLRRKDFAFTKAHCSFTEALLCVRLCAGFRGAADKGHVLRQLRIW